MTPTPHARPLAAASANPGTFAPPRRPCRPGPRRGPRKRPPVHAPRNTLCLAALLLACTAKQVRPAPDAALVGVFADDADHGIAVYQRAAAEDHTRFHYVRQTVAGPTTWQRGIEGRYEIDDQAPPHILAGSLVVPAISGQAMPAGSLLQLRLADGALREWTPPVPLASVAAVVGDHDRVFVVWRGAPPGAERPATLAVAAHDATTGERLWTHSHTTADAVVHTRLDERHLFVGLTDHDWLALRRDDGRRVNLPALDTPGLCRAHGRWWAQRDAGLVSLDLAGDQAPAYDTPASFIPPDFIHQWSLVDCTEHRDEVLLKINIGPTRSGMLVGVDATTLTQRWTVDLPHAFPAITDPRDTWPARLGDVVIVDQQHVPCVVDLPARALRGCASWRNAAAYPDGEDWLIDGRHHRRDVYETYVARLRGSDGQISAAVAIDATSFFSRQSLGGGKLWSVVHADHDDDETHDEQIPLLVLDATTLRPAAPGAFGRTRADAHVRDVLPQIDAHFFFDKEPPPPTPIPEPPTPGNPLEDLILGHTETWRSHRPTHDPEHNDSVTRAALAQAGLPADTPVRILARRGHYLLGYAATPGRWTLLEGTYDRTIDVAARSFERRPTATDVYRFILDAPPEHLTRHPIGQIDEAAWRELVDDHHFHLWQIP